MMKPDRLRVLFLCTGNSCRSQMAEGFCRHYVQESLECASAGIETHGLNPHAVAVMEEIGIDISLHTSKTVADLAGQEFDYVITVCGHANETCPYFPARTRIIHQGFADPPQMAKYVEGEEEKLNCYRQIRDEIKAYVLSLPSVL